MKINKLQRRNVRKKNKTKYILKNVCRFKNVYLILHIIKNNQMKPNEKTRIKVKPAILKKMKEDSFFRPQFMAHNGKKSILCIDNWIRDNSEQLTLLKNVNFICQYFELTQENIFENLNESK